MGTRPKAVVIELLERNQDKELRLIAAVITGGAGCVSFLLISLFFIGDHWWWVWAIPCAVFGAVMVWAQRRLEIVSSIVAALKDELWWRRYEP